MCMDRETMTDSNSNSERSGESFDEESDNGLSSSSGSTNSSDDEDAQNNTLEMAKISDEVLKLPRGLCENSDIFQEFFSMKTWQLLSENFKTYLMNKYFPSFSHDIEDQAEKEKTVTMLFNNQILRFGQSPMLELQRNLEEGNYRPDVLKLRQSITKSRKREQRFQSCERISLMARQLFISRERLLRTTYKSSPAEIVSNVNKTSKRPHTLILDTSISAVRARKRFSSEIKNILQLCDVSDISDEENNLENDFREESQKESRLNSSTDETNSIRSNPTNSEKCIYDTQFKRKHDTTDEDTARAQYESKHPKLSNRNFKQYLLEHKRRKIIEPNLPEYETMDIRLRDVYTRAQVGGNFKRIFASGKTPGRKPKSKLKSTLATLPALPMNSTSDKCAAISNSEIEDKIIKCERDVHFDQTGRTVEAVENTQRVQQKMHNVPRINNSIEFDSLQVSYNKEQELPQLSAIDGNAKTCPETRPTLINSSNEILQQQTASNACKEVSNNLWEEEVKTTLSIQPKVETMSMPQEPVSNTALVTQSMFKDNSKHTASRFLIESDNEASTRNLSFEAEVTAPKEVYSNQKEVNGGHTISKQALQSTSGPELLQETHACFFSLLRDFFCSTPNHRMKFDELREKVSTWICNPITALNDWYSLADSWSALLTSAINFLAGDFAEQPDEYVPYIEYKSQQNIYQWIGAGRDSDARLLELSNYWLSYRNKMSDKTYELKIETNSNLNPTRRSSTEIEDLNAYERGISPPPAPRCPTTWTVIAATNEEVTEFQQQERERFENPHRAYTYRMHGYESVVGPVKGIYSQILALTKARGHSMMIGDRPNFVTILTLVRDATARLPNGEGTRADISELLKCSQYINRDAAENVLQTIVSGALDRMHTEHDPCVRYDPKRKIWIYLHRNRSEEDFERMHQQYQGLGKHKKPSNRKTKPKTFKDATEGDIVGNAYSTMGVGMATQSACSNIYSLPALVPANPVIVNTAYNQPIKQQQQQLAKCPPVPPLKYNIQPLQQQQKSLLKSTLQPNRSFDLKPVDSNLKTGTQGNEFGASYLAHLQSNTTTSATTITTQTASMPSSLLSFPNKSLSFAVATSNASKVTNILNSNNTTPIIVATPSGLKTVHVSNATSVSSSTASSPAIQLVKSDTRQTIHASALSATVGGKKVALNKPIIINQITQQTQMKTHKSPQSHPTKQLQKCQQQSFVIPTMHLNSSGSEQQPTLIYENDMKTTTKESGNIQTVFMENAKICNQEAQLSQTQAHNTNIIRILPGATASNKSLVTVPIATSAKQPAHIIGQRIITNAPTLNSQLLPKHVPGISLISNNSNNNAQQLTPGAIVRMSSQAFASLHQKQTQQHVLVKQSPTNQQHRVVMGRSAINANIPHSASKNILVQQMPGTLVSAPKAIGHQSGQTSKSVTSVMSIAPQTSNSKIQTINATNLTGQQQKILLQNLKQQSLQFKTVQVLPQQQQQQQPQQQQQQQSQQSRLNTGGQNFTKTVTTNTLAPLGKTTEQQTKTVTVSVSQPQTMPGLLKQTNSQQLISKDIKTVSKVATDLRNINNSTGQIISLEGLLAKQGGTLRVANATTMAKVSQTSNIIQLTPNMVSQDATQYTASSQQARNLITVGTGQQLQSTQTGSNASVFTTPISMSVGQVKDTPKYMTTGAKIVASQGNAQTNIKTPHIVNSNMFGKVSSNTSAAGGFKIISSGGISTNFNIANIHGKQVILASKPAATLTTTANHAQKLQNSTIILGGQPTKLQGNANVKLISKAGTVCSQANSPHLQTVLVGNQILRIDQLPNSIKQQIQTSRIAVSAASPLPLTTVANTNTGTVAVNSSETILQQPSGGTMPKTFILGSSGQKIRFQAPTTQSQQSVGTLVNKTMAATTAKNITLKPPTSRVVLAVQGGGQIFLSPNYQGASVNLKSLQNVKVVSMAQTQPLPSHDNQHQERTQKTSPQKLTQQSILRASSSGIEKS